MQVKCLAQGHNTMSPAKTQTQSSHSGDENTNNEVTAPSIDVYVMKTINLRSLFYVSDLPTTSLVT